MSRLHDLTLVALHFANTIPSLKSGTINAATPLTKLFARVRNRDAKSTEYNKNYSNNGLDIKKIMD
ncbi:MAG: hypothetical protein GX409_00925 [candidate division Zixibacteria bacterium]|nr:hypothetical protein [candidate division Zixibacteria bacterium]